MILSFQNLKVSPQPLGVCLEQGNIILPRSIACTVANESVAYSDAEREQPTSATDNRKWIHGVYREDLFTSVIRFLEEP